MGGNKIGGAKTAKANKEKYGEDYYVRIGALGGKIGTTGGFGNGEQGRELARRAGVLGGKAKGRKTRAESR